MIDEKKETKKISGKIVKSVIKPLGGNRWEFAYNLLKKSAWGKDEYEQVGRYKSENSAKSAAKRFNIKITVIETEKYTADDLIDEVLKGAVADTSIAVELNFRNGSKNG